MFASIFTNSSLQDYIKENTIDPWVNTSFEGYVFLSPKQKGEFGERFVTSFFSNLMECKVERAITSTAGYDRMIDNIKTEIKFAIATRKKGKACKDSFIINHVSLAKDWERLVFFGINPDENDVRMYYFTKEDFTNHIHTNSNLFAHQQGGKKIGNDDFICVKVNELLQQDWVHHITEW